MQSLDTEHVITLMEDLMSTVRKPQQIRADSGPQFTSKRWEQFMHSKGVKLHITTALRHEANGIVERVIQTIQHEMIIRVCEFGDLSQWCKALKRAVDVYNNAPHSATGQAPRDLLIPNPQTLYVQLASSDQADHLPEAPAVGGARVRVRKQDIHSESASIYRDRVISAMARQEKGLEARKRLRIGEVSSTFKKGDHVLMRQETRSFKLRPRYTGPFLVESTRPKENTYVIKDVRDPTRKKTVHVTNLLSFDASRTPSVQALAALDDGDWVIVRVLNHASEESSDGTTTTYALVLWEGFTNPTWVDITTLASTKGSPLDLYLGRKNLRLDRGCVVERPSRERRGPE